MVIRSCHVYCARCILGDCWYATVLGTSRPLRPEAGQRLELVGGSLDALLLDLTGFAADEVDTGVALATELGQFGAGGRALYDPRPGDPARFDWSGDIP